MCSCNYSSNQLHYQVNESVTLMWDIKMLTLVDLWIFSSLGLERLVIGTKLLQHPGQYQSIFRNRVCPGEQVVVAVWRHRPRHSEELRKTKRKHRVSASRHHARDHHEPTSRYDDRSRYGGVRRETLLHGSYSDYMREYQRSRHSSSLPPLRSHFSTRTVDVPSYYPPLHISHSSSRSGGYHRPVDQYAAACDEFLRRTQSDRGSSSRYRSRRR